MSDKKVGRPELKDPIKHQITVRLRKETMDKLKVYCERNDMTKGEAVRKGVEMLLDKQ